ncbi:MAG TPA: hypothetical protein VLG76_01165 [Rhabdochlamydiaceae bacterium]|nr:hypothetical protein [Rhabdochlamydiaceae bacterium]
MAYKVDSKSNNLQLSVSYTTFSQYSISSKQASSIQSIQPPTRNEGVIRSVFNRIYSLSSSFVRSLGQAKPEDIVPDFERHLPEELYAKCLKYKLIDTIEDQMAAEHFDGLTYVFTSEKGAWKGSILGKEKLTIRFSSARKYEGRDYPEGVVIEHEPAKIENNYGGEEFAFSNKKLTDFAFYDAEGLCYLPDSSFSPSEKLQIKVINHISDRLSHFK